MRPGKIFGYLVALVAIAAVVGLALRPATVTGSSETALAYSMRGAAEADKTGVCSGDNDKFACKIFASNGRRARFKVMVGNYGCWDATRQGGGKKGLAKNLSGCITVLDLLRFNN